MSTGSSEKYKKTLDLAIKEADDEELRSKNFRRLGNMNAIKNSVHCGVHNTNLNLYKEINTLSLSKDRLSIKNTKDHEGEDLEEEDQKEDFAYWNILNLTENTQIKSLFSMNNWEEMVESFNNEVKLNESDFLDVIEYFFDEVSQIIKKDDKDINAIDRLTLKIIETN
ncbi:2568_t:CDS:2 [Funneliformis mosseae]|uniref:2568_t:CDS:1 n=1 Tax=Funneliformis mosseae TaxID=27381 RepID=A0A9N9GJW8_FUNMO|nr:2568_t:CDS:2 [Funneliformis mosseae]